MASISCLLFWILCPLFILLAVITWVIEPQTARIRRLHQAGHNQRAIASQLRISRYKVRKAIAA
jgi:hypothetical protein